MNGYRAMIARGIAALAVLCAALPGAAGALPAGAPRIDPDFEPEAPPAAVMKLFEDERFSFTEGARTKFVYPPAGSWDRVILEYTVDHGTDPWDRLFGVAIGGVEVLRGTTPRWHFTLRKDITEFASLLPAGEKTEVATYLGSWVGYLDVSVTIEFYENEETKKYVEPAATSARGIALWGRLNGNGQKIERSGLAFPATAPSKAVVEITLTGHGGEVGGGSNTEEFWYTSGPHRPRIFHVSVDGVEVAQAVALPYVYALAGSSPGGYINQSWWMAFGAIDPLGVHTGVGEVPPYRMEVDPANLHLLSGTRTVTITQQNGNASWVTSLSFLLTA